MSENWLLRSRTRPIPDKRRTVQRQQLLKRTLGSVDGGVLLVDAPPGFGKTALLADVSRRLQDQLHKVAWFTLDTADDPSAALRYLFFAVDEEGLDCHAETIRDAAPAIAVQRLLSHIEQSGDRWMLVLDNVAAARAEVTEHVLAPLLRFMPDGLTIALATEGGVPLPLSELDRRGLLHRLGADDLIFDRAEIGTLAGRAATDHQIRAIERKSGGWPALAQIMIARRFGTESGGARRDAVEDFLNARLLAPMSTEDRDVFARLSLLDRFSRSLAAQLIPAVPSEEILTRLIERRLVCRIPSDEGLDLAVHPAFVNLARKAFEMADPDAARDFRERAAQAYLAAGCFVHATAMAVSLADEALIGEIIEACNPLRLWFELGLGPLRRIVDLLPPDMARSNARIGYACIIYWSKMGRLKACGDLFAHIERRMQEEGTLADLPLPLRIERLMCRSLLAIYQGTPLSMSDVEELEALAPLIPGLEPLIRTAAGTTRCYVLQMESAFDAARQAAREAIGHADHVQSPYAAFFLHCDIAMIAGIKGDAPAAWTAFHAGERACQTALRGDERLTMIRDAFRLELQHETDPAENGASARLRNICRRLPGLDGWPDVFAAAFRTYSEKLVLSGDDRPALALIDAGVDYADRQGVRSLTYILEHHRLLLLMLANDAMEARRAYEELSRRELLHPGFRPWRAYEAMVEARAALAFRFGDPEVEALLGDAVGWAARHGNLRSELRFRSLRSGLGLAADSNDLVAALSGRSGFHRASLIVERLRLPHPLIGGEGGRQDESPVSAFFTPRELAVLEGAGRGLSDKALALELGITPHGVRYHLKRIYAQLGVHNREDACRKAREAVPAS
ncbi:LuxR C-terminal-related transcriptional regulator [Sphingosinicella soli]|uniref:LuxR family maltose regulon positive regulatory protein n=1 Tax=Sphingosinicella soli TaxID=333708 RepID=A0A7W7B350_9SPHN|nr:LuxR C-terminal-related transcriptional regulator [Sphingosinicella soli]MBB4633161.1 LuxR family maltose regulon positive regulatory protein [Sphingosinicella soli]